ncbi:Hypothetical predicted protein [Pelobates cultripes]|uniref:Uncharacterized protein n=1 Tax=Pelobates cultripes TaxID=61616 RepID=A0AAD1WJC3_PELCU|nr:Hypothetical predicted protein [Pelobates cultripes]
MAAEPCSTNMYLIRKETELRYDRIIKALWKKLEALLWSPQVEASPGGMLLRPKRGGKEMDGTPLTLKMATHKKGPGPTAPKRSKAATRLRLHEAHKAKGTPKAPHQRQPRRKAAVQHGLKRSKARPDGPRGGRTVKPTLAETATLPHRLAQTTAGTSRHSPGEPVTLTTTPLLQRGAQACTLPTRGMG